MICPFQIVMATHTNDSDGFSMTSNQIFITDVGIDGRDKAFLWLSIGRYVYDHRWNEITVQSLERNIDPHDVMNPVILRGHLWKTVPTRYWQVDDGHQLGPMPSQPGLDAHCSSVYYANRRARQAGHVRKMRQPVVLERRLASSSTSQAGSRDEVRTNPTRDYRQRSDSCPLGGEEAKLALMVKMRRSRSAGDRPLHLGDEDDGEYENGREVVEHDVTIDAQSTRKSMRKHSRKYSSDVDSGIGFVGFGDAT